MNAVAKEAIQNTPDARIRELEEVLSNFRSAVGCFAPREADGALHPQLIAAYDDASAALDKASR